MSSRNSSPKSADTGGEREVVALESAGDSPDQGQAANSPDGGWITVHRAFHIKKILVPIDFSAHSRKALQYALANAREFGADLVLLHVIHPAFITKNTAQKLENWRKAISGTAARAVVRHGHAAREIIAEAAREEVDQIVISTHGRTGLAHMIMGSVAEQVVRLGPCPVLVVRDGERDYLRIESYDEEMRRIRLLDISPLELQEEQS